MISMASTITSPCQTCAILTGALASYTRIAIMRFFALIVLAISALAASALPADKDFEKVSSQCKKGCYKCLADEMCLCVC
jgi:hypothetical protein